MRAQLLKYAFFIITCIASTLEAQTRLPVVIPDLGKEENDNFQRAREEWIRKMHRAEPGLNTQAIDAATREAKAAELQLMMVHRNAIQSIPQDTFAGGRIIGSWSERGSVNVCGRTHTADIDFETDTIFVASSMGDIWKTKVGDSVWTILNDGHRFGDIRMLRVIHTSGGKRIVAACNGPVTVRYSDDGGKTWSDAKGLDGPKSWGGIKRATMSANEDTIYLAGNEWDYSKNWRAVSFLYRSTDQGAHFKKIANWNISTDLIDVWQSRDTTTAAYFIKADSLFVVTGDTTLALAEVFTNDSIAKANALYLDGKVTVGKTIVGVCAVTNGVSEIFLSNDSLKNWTYNGYISASPFSANSFRLSMTEPTQCYLGGVNVNISTPDSLHFATPHQWWEYYGDIHNKLHADIDGIDVFRDLLGNEVTLFSTDGGTFISHDRMQTVKNLTYSGIRTSQYYSTYTSSPPYVINAGAQDQGWQRGSDDHIGELPMNQIISGDYGHLVSSDSGNSVWGDYPGFAIYYFDARNSGSHHDWSFVGSNKLWMPPMCASPSDPATAYIACGDTSSKSSASHLWKLSDDGAKVNTEMLPYDFSLANSGRQLSAISFSPFDTNTIYALSNDGYFYLSSDNGTSWKHSDTTRAPGSHYFYGSSILPSRLVKNKLWVAGSGYSNPAVYLSTDNGQTFMPADSGLPRTLVYGIVSTNDEKFLFAATDVGPYVYSADAMRWYDLAAAFGTTAPDMVYWSLEKVPQSNIVRFGTYGRGMWDFNIDTILYVKNSVRADAASAATLNVSALPSVAEDHTTITLTLPLSGDVTLSIYDIEGRAVKHFRKYLTEGTNNFLWDLTSDAGARIPSGFYTAIISANNAVGFAKIEAVR
ncbi:MAG TPA: hypothetical protein VEW28_01785 [Candidatus Kapabacteria bacterium]|nr:hypothetical protein [Candidatus Kapabacteria bacterium]